MLPNQKKFFLGFLTILIVFLTGTFIATDVITIYVIKFAQNYSPIAKLICSFLSVVIALSIGKNCISKKDAIMLKFALPLCFIGDIFVTINNYWYNNPTIFLFGGISFIFSVTLFILRHSKGFSFLKENTIPRLFLGLLFFPPLIFIIVFFFNELVKFNLLMLTIVYGTIVVLFLWTGTAAYIYRLFPKPNALMIFYGSICFFMMEVTGQLYNLKIPYLAEIGFILSWAFYVPSLVLLSFSGYRFEAPEETGR